MVWKPSQQANMLQIAQAYLDRVHFLLKAQEVTTKDVYRLPQAIYYFC